MEKQYLVYDTNLLTTDNNYSMDLNLKREGIYSVKIFNINITFQGGYTVDTVLNYLSFTGTQELQYGSLTVGGMNKTSQKGILFPIYNPQGFYQTNVENKINFNKNDSFIINVLDSNFNPAQVTRLVVVLHIDLEKPK